MNTHLTQNLASPLSTINRRNLAIFTMAMILFPIYVGLLDYLITLVEPVGSSFSWSMDIAASNDPIFALLWVGIVCFVVGTFTGHFFLGMIPPSIWNELVMLRAQHAQWVADAAELARYRAEKTTQM